MPESLAKDIAAVARIGAVPTILQVISETTGLGFALVTRVTDTEWRACAVHDRISFGLGVGDALDVATTMCAEVRDSRQPLAIDHASEDLRYCNHPIPKMYGFESYVAVPIFRTSGEYFGNVCALDRKPAHVRDPKVIEMMKLFAQLISLQLEAEEEHAESAAALVEAKTTAELREQFIAVLGHDLRNPLSAIAMGAHLLLSDQLLPGSRATVERIARSTRRIEHLVANVLDLARGRLGGGFPIDPTHVNDLEVRLRHVVDEVASSHPSRTIHLTFDGSGPVVCDRGRIEQVLSNLLANAIEHGDREEAVDVRIAIDDALTITVVNRGAPIPRERLARLFHPFTHGEHGRARRGLGLGLFIVSEIAKAHGGSVRALSSADEGTAFTFTIPRTARATSTQAVA